MLEYAKYHWKESEIYRFSRSITQNILRRPTMVDIFGDFQPPSKKFLATPLNNNFHTKTSQFYFH